MRGNLTDLELDTYARQIVLSDIGYEGQLALRNATVCLLGLGGLGSPAALQLAGMGVGGLRLVDRDVVSRSDLHRQYLYDVDAIGRPKVEAAGLALRRLNPDVAIDPRPESIAARTIDSLIEGVDVVVDGLDRPGARYLANRACRRLGVPYVFGAAVEAFGNLSTLLPGRSACLECFMGGLKDEDLPVCGAVGVHPAVLGLVASLQVAEAVRIVTGREPKLAGRMLSVDVRDLEFQFMELKPSRDCPVCGPGAGEPPPVEEKPVEETCARDGRRTFFVTPRDRVEVGVERLAQLLQSRGYRGILTGGTGVSFESDRGVRFCVLASGVMIAQTAATAGGDIRGEITETYRSLLVEGLGLPAAIAAL